jgi:hypothetical protein
MPRPNGFVRYHFVLKTGFAVAVGLILGMGHASADPGNMQIGTTSTGPYTPTGTGNETVGLGGPGTVYVWQNRGGAATQYLNSTTAGFLLLLGIPNDTTGTFFSSNPVTSGNGTLGGTPVLGGSWNKTTGFAGFMPTANADAYLVAGLDKIDGSESFTNWSQWDSSVNGITATDFGIYVLKITGTLDGKTSVGVTFSSLPKGTFVIAYGEDLGGKTDGTAFTEAGLTTSGDTTPNLLVPAPSSVILLGFGGLGFVLVLARSRRRVLVAA